MKEEKTDPRSSKPSPDPGKAYARISGITFELLTLNLGIIGLGYYLNEKVGSSFPWFLLLGIFLSVAATIFYLLKKFSS